jgi:hypothetical protein
MMTDLQFRQRVTVWPQVGHRSPPLLVATPRVGLVVESFGIVWLLGK